MNIDAILRLLKNSGFNEVRVDGSYIHMEDPSCILRSFEVFFDYAWIVIVFITGILIFGWAISLIRAGKGVSGLVTNIRNLTLIFGILAATKPIINLIWGGDLFATGCKTITVSIADVRKILDARNQQLSKRNADALYEEFDIYDSGAVYSDTNTVFQDTPAPIPVYSAGDIQAIPASITPSGSGSSVTSVSSQNNDVIYTNSDGTRTRRSGGYRSWRNNNPGNIRYSEFARKQGAIGEAGGFAVFPDEATGMRAIGALITSKNYINLTVGGAINRYAPPSENDTAAYQKTLERKTGIPLNTPMKSLSDDQVQRVATVIREIEGWKPGKETRI